MRPTTQRGIARRTWRLGTSLVELLLLYIFYERIKQLPASYTLYFGGETRARAMGFDITDGFASSPAGSACRCSELRSIVRSFFL